MQEVANSVRHEICQGVHVLVHCIVMKKKRIRLGKTGEKAVGEASPPIGQGFKYVRLVGHLLERLHGAATERDRAGNRQLFYDHYATLLLLYFFTPTVTSLRGLQQLTTLVYIQRRWGVQRTALGSLSEAATVFEAALLQDVISELALRAWTRAPQGNPALLQGDAAVLRDLVAIDGSLLPALPRMVWAVWQDAQHRAAKMHVAFAALRQVPVGVTVTAGNDAERAEARRLVQPGGFYVFDRGYVDYALFAEWHALPCSFVVRVQEGAAYGVAQERPLTAAARAAAVTRDVVLRRLGTAHHRPCQAQPLRVVRVATDKVHPDGTPVELVLVTNRLDLEADLIALAYRYRWTVELFFRWLKCILGCRHLLSQSENGVRLQIYMALIASLLISLWVGRAPSKRTYEMLCHYLSGWASIREVIDHVDRLHLTAPPGKK
jgi:Transposase DDE domain